MEFQAFIFRTNGQSENMLVAKAGGLRSISASIETFDFCVDRNEECQRSATVVNRGTMPQKLRQLELIVMSSVFI